PCSLLLVLHLRNAGLSCGLSAWGAIWRTVHNAFVSLQQRSLRCFFYWAEGGRFEAGIGLTAPRSAKSAPQPADSAPHLPKTAPHSEPTATKLVLTATNASVTATKPVPTATKKPIRATQQKNLDFIAKE